MIFLFVFGSDDRRQEKENKTQLIFNDVLFFVIKSSSVKIYLSYLNIQISFDKTKKVVLSMPTDRYTESGKQHCITTK
jgi:hypothetical protein